MPTTSTRTPAAFSLMSASFNAIDAGLIHVPNAVHAQNQDLALCSRLAGDIEELVAKPKKSGPSTCLMKSLSRTECGMVSSSAGFISDRRERRHLAFHDLAHALHEYERGQDEACGHCGYQIG